jgi:peptidoglycan LD-endopeptidase CwlK
VTFKLGALSLTRLKGVHPDLVKVVMRAIQISTLDFTVLEGIRSLERQKALVEAGSSQTLKSRHLTGHAVDLGAWVDSQLDWSWPLYPRIAGAMKMAAKEFNVPIEWGGDWEKFKDGPHFQLPWKEYP